MVHPRAQLVNVYGPTECTCICSAYRVTEVDFENLDGYPPLGGPIANFSFTVLNDRNEAVLPGEHGELCLGGPCVGLGYFNDEDLTQKAFQQNPLNQKYREQIYRTGDLVFSSKDDDKIYFVGRKDSQIKHQGYRIELGEVEHALRRIPGVDEAAAIHSAGDGISQIIAIVASRNGISSAEVRGQLSNSLPPYMVPARVDVVDRLPRNANGKIDRNLIKTQHCHG